MRARRTKNSLKYVSVVGKTLNYQFVPLTNANIFIEYFPRFTQTPIPIARPFSTCFEVGNVQPKHQVIQQQLVFNPRKGESLKTTIHI